MAFFFQYHFFSQAWVALSPGTGLDEAFEKFVMPLSVFSCIYIKGITQDIENEFQFNTVISKYRELTNVIYDWTSTKKELNDEDKNVLSYAIITLIKLIAPTIVHMAEELYSALGFKESVHKAQWPTYDDNLAKMSTITLVAQVNGKIKDKIEVDAEASKDELEKIALNSEKVKDFIGNKKIVKVIVVPGKLVNIVVAG